MFSAFLRRSGHDSNVSETENPKTESETESKEEKQAQKGNLRLRDVNNQYFSFSFKSFSHSDLFGAFASHFVMD